MIGYVTIGTNDMPRALAFWDALLGEVGGRRAIDFGPRGALYAAAPGPMLGVMAPYDGNKATPGNGNMVALAAADHAEVDKLYHKALALGATDEGAPGPRGGEDSDFYAAYFRDLDHNKICAYHWRKG